MAMPATAPDAMVQRIAVVCPRGTPLLQLRDVLIGEARSRGCQVLVVAPEFNGSEARALSELGAEHTIFMPEQAGLKLFADWKAIGRLKQVLADW